ncbi:SGNH/GDSL hydrolase family protein [Streptomyces sp. MS1.HAVA.3]|uniref:SGNH/GDSL hydrolase family protein n=1 Tax=Streptomyces caledonius TaxID=3134107 RepID=A0ABU8UAN0_9ACTN
MSWKPSRFAALTSSLLLAVGAALFGAGQAAAAARADFGYVALGDSVLLRPRRRQLRRRERQLQAHHPRLPGPVGRRPSPQSFSFTACSGARTNDVLAGQLAPLNSGTDLVSITIGGNDAGFSDVMTTCVLQSESTCISRVNQAKAYVDSTLPGRLDQVYSAIDSRSPGAHVVVLGYPRFYKLNGTCTTGLTEGERAAINAAADHLNAAIAKRAADHGFTFASVAGAFTGHEICSGSAWLHSVNWLNIAESYHPTAAGQSGGYLPAFTNAA